MKKRHRVTLIALFLQAGSPQLFSGGSWSKLYSGIYCCCHVSDYVPFCLKDEYGKVLVADSGCTVKEISEREGRNVGNSGKGLD